MSFDLARPRHVLAALALLAALPAFAEPVSAPTLRWSTDGGVETAAVTHSLDVAIDVNGMIAETRVVQHFRNDGNAFLQGEYLLPLPEGAAVHGLVLAIGARRVEGEIREREQARAEFQAAAAAGQRTSLVEQQQANLFRTAVANVAPGEEVAIEVSYWQRVRFHDGRFELAFPLTFVPRYDNGAGAMSASFDPRDDGTPESFAVGPPVTMHVALHPGLPVQSVESVTHGIDVAKHGEDFDVSLIDERVRADRDFVLTWQPQPQAAPGAAVFVEHAPDADYAMVMMLAPEQREQRLPRELILVIDTSGSMLGDSIAQAKAALDAALVRLTPRDRFNVIEFNSETTALFPQPVAADAKAIAVAREWVSLLEADGGTEMLPALTAALAGKAPEGFVRQVVFATDGAVTEEEQLYGLIEAALGDSRLFPVGIGDAPNGHFLAQAARMGRGADVVVRDLADVDARMGELFAKLDKPALRDLALTWPGVAETYPARLPDLYQGEPLVAVAKLGKASGEVEATGLLRDSGWRRTLPLARVRSDAGIARLWAQGKVESLEDELNRGVDEALVRPQIVDVALMHHLVTRYTSLVAVDRTPVRPADAALARAAVANGTPGGDELAFAQGATPKPLSLALGFAGLLLVLTTAMPRTRRAIALA